MKNPYIVADDVSNANARSANTDLLAADFTPKFDGYLHIQATMVTASTFKVIRKAASGGDAIATLILNSVANQTATGTFNYTVLVRKGYYYNFQIGTQSVVSELLAFFCAEGRGS